MEHWKRIVLWVIVAALVFSFAVCQKKTQQAKTAKAPKAAEVSSVPEDARPAEEQEPAEESAVAEEKPAIAAEEPKTTEPSKPPEAVAAKPAKPITRDNAAAIIELQKGGRIVIDFYPEDAPNTVDSFIKLANKGFYNGLMFHRVLPGSLVQSGCPQGDGYGGPGYTIKAEFNSQKHVAGTIAMGRKEGLPDSAGSQFYICLTRLASLDGNYTVFGQVIEGMDLVKGIVKGDVMKKVTIVDKASVKK